MNDRLTEEQRDDRIELSRRQITRMRMVDVERTNEIVERLMCPC